MAIDSYVELTFCSVSCALGYHDRHCAPAHRDKQLTSIQTIIRASAVVQGKETGDLIVWDISGITGLSLK